MGILGSINLLTIGLVVLIYIFARAEEKDSK
jgi:hypothetical protein